MVMDTTAMDTITMEHFIAMEMEYTMEALDKMVEITPTETRQHHLLITTHAF